MESFEDPTGMTFGRNYAVLNLDLMRILIDGVRGSPLGDAFILNCSRWIDAIHGLDVKPLTSFTSLYFSSPSRHELRKGPSPFGDLISDFGRFQGNSPDVRIDSSFLVHPDDIVLQKTRWYAGSGNGLEQILRAQNIDTVIIVSTLVSLFSDKIEDFD
jgi:hypothetical protein